MYYYMYVRYVCRVYEMMQAVCVSFPCSEGKYGTGKAQVQHK